MSKTTNYQLEKYDDNTNCDFRFINGSLDKIDTELKKVSDKANEKKIIIKDIYIYQSNWIKGSWSEYPNVYEYTIFDSNITSADVVDINIRINYLVNGHGDSLFSASESLGGGVKIYSDGIPKGNLSATMVIQKAVI